MVLGTIIGLALGHLDPREPPALHRTTAEVLLRPLKPAAAKSGHAESLPGPLNMLQSEDVLRLAAGSLDTYKPFQARPPETVRERQDFLAAGLEVSRAADADPAAPVLRLTFQAANAADAPRYLQAIIEAYRELVATGKTEASARRARQFDEEILALQKARAASIERQQTFEKQLRGVVDPATGLVLSPGVSQEELPAIQKRLQANRDRVAELSARLTEVAKDLEKFHEAVKDAGTTRAQRLEVMAKLGIGPDQPKEEGGQEDPDTALSNLLSRKIEMSIYYGPSYPEMVTLKARIQQLKDAIQKRGGPPDDELERHRRKREGEQQTLERQLAMLTRTIADDDAVVRRMVSLLQEIEALAAAARLAGSRIEEKQAERDRLEKTPAAWEVKEILPPGTAVPVHAGFLHTPASSLVLGGGSGLAVGILISLFLAIPGRMHPTVARPMAPVLPVLGQVPSLNPRAPREVRTKSPIDPHLFAYMRPNSPESECIRSIIRQIDDLTPDQPRQIIQVTSPAHSDLRAIIAANLAISCAKARKQVVLVECDPEQERLAGLFALTDDGPGLAAVLADEADPGEAVRSCEIDNLSLLTAGPSSANRPGLLESPRFQELLRELRESYDMVILDTPALASGTTAETIAPLVDSVLLLDACRSDAGPTVQARDRLAAVGGKLLGLVLHQAK
jgi:capsular exopolysaccharide synthesis family protein